MATSEFIEQLIQIIAGRDVEKSTSITNTS